MEKENPEISLAMRAITFMIMLKQIIYGNQPNSQSDELEALEIEEEGEYDWEETATEEEIALKAELNQAIAKQLPDNLKGNMELAELIRHTFYQNHQVEEEGANGEHISDG